MAAAAVAAAAEDEHGWVCRACTLLNSKDASECEGRLAERPNVSIKVYTCDFDEDIDLSPPPGYALEIIRAQFVEDDARTDFTQWLIKILSSHESGGRFDFQVFAERD